MGGKRSPARASMREFLKVSVDLPALKLDLASRNPEKSLADLRRIVEAFSTESDAAYAIDAPELFELRARLSEEFFHHQGLLGRLKSALVLDEDVRIAKQILPLEREYDLATGSEHIVLGVAQVKQVVSQLFAGLDLKTVRECLVHIRGELSREDQNIIMDCIKQSLGVDGSVRFFSTRKNLEGRVLLEAVCFIA